MSKPPPIYKVCFLNRGEVYARRVVSSNLYGFIEVEGYVFASRGQVVVDTSEERLKAELANVKRSYIPIPAVIRIDEVEKCAASKISSAGKVAPFPMSVIGKPAAHGSDGGDDG